MSPESFITVDEFKEYIHPSVSTIVSSNLTETNVSKEDLDFVKCVQEDERLVAFEALKSFANVDAFKKWRKRLWI